MPDKMFEVAVNI